METQIMLRVIVALFLLLAAQQANAAECGSTANREGCVGANGAATYNKNTGVARTAQPYHLNEVAPGAHAEGWRVSSAYRAAMYNAATHPFYGYPAPYYPPVYYPPPPRCGYFPLPPCY